MIASVIHENQSISRLVGHLNVAFLNLRDMLSTGCNWHILVPKLFLQTEFPLLLRLNDAYSELPAFQAAMPERQPDYILS